MVKRLRTCKVVTQWRANGDACNETRLEENATSRYSHTCDFHCETYIVISPYHTGTVVFIMRLISASSHTSLWQKLELQMYNIYAMCDFIMWENTNTFHIFHGIWVNTAHVQWITCSPNGSHLMHWRVLCFSILHSNEHCLHINFYNFTEVKEWLLSL